MKAIMLIGAVAVAVLIAVPAVADNQNQSNPGDQGQQGAQYSPAYQNQAPQYFDMAPHGWPSQNAAKQCFNGKGIAGVNRSGARTLYLQSNQGGIYQMRLTGDCDGLNNAEKLTVRANGSDVICPGDNAELIARISTTAKHCRVADVRRLTAKEVSVLASAAR